MYEHVHRHTCKVTSLHSMYTLLFFSLISLLCKEILMYIILHIMFLIWHLKAVKSPSIWFVARKKLDQWWGCHLLWPPDRL